MKNLLKKDWFIIVFCVIGATFGPILFINANFKYSFFINGLLFSIASLLLYYVIFVVNKYFLTNITKNFKYLSAIILGITPLVGFYLYWFDIKDLLWYSASMGLANFSVIFILSMIILIVRKNQGESTKNNVYIVGIFYLFPITILFLLSYFFSNEESKVLLVNVGILYFLLKNLVVKKVDIVHNS